MSGLIFLSLLACQHGITGGYSSSQLPEWVAATVRFKDGSYGSALVTLGDPRSPPVLRYAPGLLVFDGKRLLKMELAPRLKQGARVVQDLGVQDLASGARMVLPLGDLGEALSLDAINEGQIRVTIDGQVAWFDAFTGDRNTAPVEEMSTTHFGPGHGFELVTREDDVVSLRLPLADKGLPLFQDVESVLSMSWIASNEASSRALSEAERLFKSVMPVYPEAAHAVADGDLDEWRGARALAVDNLPCVLAGSESWGGPRDGSFGVAARVSEGRLILAIRVRDDALISGSDRVEIELDGRIWTIPVSGAGPIAEQQDVSGAFTMAVEHGTGLELSLPLPPRPEEMTPLPLVVRYIDADPDQLPTTLATAPSMRALAVRTH